MVTKPTKEFTDAMGRRKIKGNMDIELAIDVMEMAEHLDHVVLFSGDGDFRRLVEAVQRKGVRVTVVSTIKSSPPMVADELRRQADDFIELAELAPLIAAQPVRARPPRPKPADGDAPAEDAAAEHLMRLGLSAELWPTQPFAEPPRDCPLCPGWWPSATSCRAVSRLAQRAGAAPSAPLDAGLLIVGLAPGMKGANRTGRPFTGDYAGDLLYSTLLEVRLRAGHLPRRSERRLRAGRLPHHQRRALRAAARTSRCRSRHRLPAVPAGRDRRRCPSSRCSGTGQGRARPDAARR